MSNAGVVRRRCLLRPAAALGWSPCTVCSPAGQFHSISCSTDSYVRSRLAVSTESPYKRHFCGLAVHAVRRVLGLLPGPWAHARANLICQCLIYQAGKETQHSLHSMYRKFTKSAATCSAIPYSTSVGHLEEFWSITSGAISL